ncbi:MAG: molecular chaperone DnaJ [Burkholderiales bacterium]|nr:molecular chaperone DnaJ [Nitrosomonas sp.]MCP5274635.1 molecular chaperone DnaJ [Burkholderiales bacterium]
MKERRNLYRTLYAQPDAPLAVIKANHRILMQKLKLHPDQGFADLQASLLNTAYTVLQDPLKRADYDRQLQKRHPIRKLSLGSLAEGSVRGYAGRAGRMFKTNQRNYYRVLQVQPDAPVEIIIASYRVLQDYPYQDNDLLEEAYTVLVNPATRVRYDALLAGRLMVSENMLITGKRTENDFKTSVIKNTACAVETNLTIGMSYCIFCHTPYSRQVSPYQNDLCLECASPLPASVDDQINHSRRTNIRISAQEEIKFYLYWPDTPFVGILQDLSPRGVRFLADSSLDPYDIIKIDALKFKAVAEVAHKQCDENCTSIGVRFLTFKFEQERGNFLTISV